MPHDPGSGVHFEVHGEGVPLVLGFPHLASFREVFGPAAAPVWQAWLDGLTDRYRVLVMDYPNIGKSHVPLPGEMTVERVCADMLSVASAVGFDRFAWVGYTWGAVVGLQLAARSPRVSGLVVGGWSPIGAQYDDMLHAVRLPPTPHAMAVLRDAAQYAQWTTFYESLTGMDEREILARIRCPALVYNGANAEPDVAGGVRYLRIARTNRLQRLELERMGWVVEEIPNADNNVLMQPDRVLPVVRRFLDGLSL
jgi:pimeloyl-ACP methyl ester carboxylesterase